MRTPFQRAEHCPSLPTAVTIAAPSDWRPRRPTPLTVGIAVASAMLLGACSPQTPLTEQTSTTPTRTAPSTAPTTSPPSEPAPEPTSTLPTRRSESSWEVVESFFNAYTYGLQTGDSSRLKALSSNTCASCANLIEDIEALGSREVVGTGGAFSFPQSVGHQSKYAERFVWEVHYRQAPITYTLSDPDEKTSAPAASHVLFIELTETADGWVVSGISQEVNDES